MPDMPLVENLIFAGHVLATICLNELRKFLLQSPLIFASGIALLRFADLGLDRASFVVD